MIILLGPIAALALSAAVMSSASATDQTTSTASATPESNDDLLKKYDDALFGHRYADALQITDQLRPDNPNGQAYVMGLRAAALLGLHRDAEARDLIAKAEELAPAQPDASRAIFLGSLITDRPEFAADAFDRLIGRAPDVVRDLEWDTIRYFLNHEPKGQDTKNEDRRIALARIGYGGDTDIGHWRAVDAINILVKRGDFQGASELLPYVNDPQALENMLIQKRYSPLWPQLAELAGEHLARVREQSVRSAEQDYASAPNDHQKLQFYANALRHAGRLDDAIALRSKLPATSAEMSSVDEQMGWAVNNVALALHEVGRGDDADALFAMLNDAPMPKEYWRVSMKINRLELLVLDGKFDRALPLIEPTANVEGSPYAHQLVRRLRYCTLNAMGRKDEAAKALPELLEHAADAPGPTIDGLLCAGQLDKAEQLALQTLEGGKKPGFEEDFVRQLQVHQLTSDDPSVWQGRWQELRARPAIKQAFDRLGRDMPPELLAAKANASASK